MFDFKVSFNVVLLYYKGDFKWGELCYTLRSINYTNATIRLLFLFSWNN